jgi:hypothetical protein
VYPAVLLKNLILIEAKYFLSFLLRVQIRFQIKERGEPVHFVLLFLKFLDQSWFRSVQNSQDLSVITFPSSAEDMMLNTPVQRLKGGNPNTGLCSSRLVTCCGELSVTFKAQCKDSRTANLKTN